MGFSVAGAVAVIGVSLLIGLEVFTGDVLPSVSNANYSFKDMKDRAVDKVQTDINITNTSVAIPDEGQYNLNITVENTGSVTLNTSDFVILINGTSQTFTCSKSHHYPEKEVYFNLNNLLGTGTKRLKVVAPNGVADYDEYTVT